MLVCIHKADAVAPGQISFLSCGLSHETLPKAMLKHPDSATHTSIHHSCRLPLLYITVARLTCCCGLEPLFLLLLLLLF